MTNCIDVSHCKFQSNVSGTVCEFHFTAFGLCQRRSNGKSLECVRCEDAGKARI